MNQLINIKKVTQISAYLSVTFLIIHIGLFTLFYHYKVMPMAYYNIFSILFYIGTLPLLKKGYFRAYVLLVDLEILAHMALAEYFVGWQAGFQITLVGINMLGYFAEYLARILGNKHIPAVILCIMGMFTYIGAFIVSYLNPAPYQLPSHVIFYLQIAWGFVTFPIVIICLQSFLWLTFNSELLLSRQAVRDELTRLHNRHYITHYMNGIEKSGKMNQYWVAIADIDNFKNINDQYGHNYGDYVLQTIADILRDKCMDLEVCRWGGEEFLIIGKVGQGMEEQRTKLETFRKAVEEYDFNYKGQHLKMTVTIGAAPFDAAGNMEEGINQADKKLYEGKQTGKNKVLIQG